MEQSINFNFKAHYFQSEPITEEVTEIWFVLHGYGQLAKYFIRKFKSVANSKRVIIAPGGLSRFYLEGFKGRVGATWMTKEDRLLDIENYINYLEQVYQQVMTQVDDPSKIKIHFLGFSQGAATVTRWLQHHSADFDRLTIWAGSFPHDMDIAQLSDKLKGKRVDMVHGTKDSFITEETKGQQLKFIEALNLEVHHITFDGQHDIDEAALQKLID